MACLIAQPGVEIHVADVLAGGEAAQDDALAPRAESADTKARRSLGDAGELLDPRAREEYRTRLVELREELTEAESNNDTGRSERLRAEIEFVEKELTSAFGLGGRARKGADASERIRKGVTNRIREAIARVGKEHEPLALHLTNALRLGTFCSYVPERAVRWEI